MQTTTFPFLRGAALLLLACSSNPRDGSAGTAGKATGGTASSGGVSGRAGSGTGGEHVSGAGGLGGFGGSNGGGGVASAGTAGSPPDDARLFVPEGLPNTELDDPGGGLTLIAFTLIRGAGGPELYAAARNDGTEPACEAGLFVDFYDKDARLVTSASSVLQSGRSYRFDDGSGVVISCVPPGQIAMAATTAFSGPLVLEELGHLEHRFPAFGVTGIVPLEALSVNALTSLATETGHAFTGTLENRHSGNVSAPKVSVFAVNRVGRPLAMATAAAELDIPPGGTWSFRTDDVAALGADAVAYPAATISQ